MTHLSYQMTNTEVMSGGEDQVGSKMMVYTFLNNCKYR